VGLVAGYGSVLFTRLIHWISGMTVESVIGLAGQNAVWLVGLAAVPALGLLVVSWLTRRFAPEAEGHGVPEVITAVARHDGVIRPRVALVKILASGICIGTGGSVGREGPIVQIGSSLGSIAGQLFQLSGRNIKVLVAAGAAAGISATFHAPLAGVVFASEIILGSFAVESLTPIVIASVLADVVQTHHGEHGLDAAFGQLHYVFHGAWEQLPSYALLGLACGLAAVGFTKLLYWTEDLANKWLPQWWLRAVVLGSLVGGVGVLFATLAPTLSPAGQRELDDRPPYPALFGVGYELVDQTLRLEYQPQEGRPNQDHPTASDTTVRLDTEAMLAHLCWLLPLAFLKPLMTSLTLAGGGSGGIFAPSLFTGATLGASFGLLCNLVVPELSASPGVYAIVGMGAVVAGTTHGMLSAILIVYEMTDDYSIILPIMAAAGLASVIARFVDPESIYHKKLSRRGESIARGHDMHRVEHVMVRDVMVRDFPTVCHTDTVPQIVRVARAHADMESLPVMNENNQLVGIIRPEDLHRVLDSDISPQLVNAEDIALPPPTAVSANSNLLEALRDFGVRDVETLPVEIGRGSGRRLVGLVLRSDVMRRYRVEMLRRH
jgi:CIC family chloride channel protein